MDAANNNFAQRRQQLRDALPHTLSGLDEHAPTHRGKVRDVYQRGDELLLLTTDRISAFDVVLGTLPLKGAMLTRQSHFWLQRAEAICPTHLLSLESPSILRCRRAQALPIELVVRGYLAGSLLREPADQRGASYGLTLPADQAPYTAFATPVVTPTTKEAVGQHDQPCSLAELVSSGRATSSQLEACVHYALSLFAMGQAHAAAQGLLLVDTKYEFGLINNRVVLIDEIHTADSSRFWEASSYAQRLGRGEAPEMLDKEHLRRWLIGVGFQGNGPPPVLTDDIRIDVADRYWQLTERITGPWTPTAPTTRAASIVGRFLQG
jgi:phosphoribosylaminoimidazole-succinocarboxamide synthase